MDKLKNIETQIGETFNQLSDVADKELESLTNSEKLGVVTEETDATEIIDEVEPVIATEPVIEIIDEVEPVIATEPVIEVTEESEPVIEVTEEAKPVIATEPVIEVTEEAKPVIATEEPEDSSEIMKEIKKIIKQNNNFNYISEGRFLIGGVNEKSIKVFGEAFEKSNTLSTPSHYRLISLINKL